MKKKTAYLGILCILYSAYIYSWYGKLCIQHKMYVLCKWKLSINKTIYIYMLILLNVFLFFVYAFILSVMENKANRKDPAALYILLH